MTRLALRRVLMDDARILWEWRNDEGTRRASFSTDPVPWATHVEWLRSRLADARCILFLVEEAGRPVAQVRFEIGANGEAEADVTVSPLDRGKGLGAEAIRLASERVLARPEVQRLVAHVRPENEASMRAFARAGYEAQGIVSMKGVPAVRLERDKDG